MQPENDEKTQKNNPDQRPAANAAQKWVWIAAIVLLAIFAVWWFVIQSGNGVKQNAATPAAPAKSPVLDQKSIAVLPFVNMSADKDTDFFSDGVTEEILNALARTPGLRVTARTSAFAFKGRNDPLPTIGEALNVTAVLKGTLLKSGDKLRISAQLVRAADSFPLWSGEYDRDMTNIFVVQGDIASRVADALKVQLPQAPVPPKQPTENLAAYQLYLKARQLWNRRSSPAVAQAIDVFNQAIAADPNFALAYAGLADCYVLPSFTNLPPAEAASKARTAAQKAIDLDGTLGEPHSALAMVLALTDWNWSGAEAQFRRATELNPNYANAHHWLGIIYELERRCTEAVAELQRAQSLDPLSANINSRAGLTLCACGAVDPGIQILQRHLLADPKWVRARSSLAVCYFQQGKLPEAIQELETAKSIAGDPGAELGYLYARVGRTNDALEVSRQLSQGQPDNAGLALIQHGLGNDAAALDLLDKALAARESGLPWIASSPYWKDLRADPRVLSILGKMNLAK
jgi:TolB-like protein/Tfp pilus assembly protein PilF